MNKIDIAKKKKQQYSKLKYIAKNFITQMKNLLIILSVFTLYISFSGCKKEYNCTCISSDTVSGFKSDTTLTTYNDMDKSEAEDLCSSEEFSLGTFKKICSLE